MTVNHLKSWGDSDEHHQFILDFLERESWLSQAMQVKLEDIQRYWDLYAGKHADNRADHEKWRANVHVPYPYSGVETKVAVLSEIINQASPPIQAEGIEARDQMFSHRMENLLDYTLRINRWRHKTDGWFRVAAVQGTEILKVRWHNDSFKLKLRATDEERVKFSESIVEARRRNMVNIPIPTEDPEGFELWRKETNDANKDKNLIIPPPPMDGTQEVTRFRGPSFDRVPLEDMRFDLRIDNWQRQPFIAQRVVRTRKWLEDNMGDGPDSGKLFSAKAVEEHGGSIGADRLAEVETAKGEALDKDSSSSEDPMYRDAVELFEVWTPFDEAKYSVILNKSGVINWDPRELPYAHGQTPYMGMRNVFVPGHALGISELQQTEEMYYELNQLRNLRLDAVTLAVLPILLRAQGMGIPDLQKYISPGMIMDVNMVDGIKNLMAQFRVPHEAFREIDGIKGDIDETNATTQPVRGHSATVGRVSATESERRFAQALSRLKQCVVRYEEELHPLIMQSLVLWYQFGKPEERVQIAGPGEPYMETFDKRDLLRAMEMDFNFRGATQALNKEMQAQQLMGFAEKFAAALTPGEGRHLARTVYEALGMKDKDQVITAENTKMMEDQYMLKIEAERAQLMQATAAVPPQGQPGAPDSVSPEEAAALQAQGSQAPPPEEGGQ